MFTLLRNLTLPRLVSPSTFAADPEELPRREELRRIVNLRLNPIARFYQSLPQLDKYLSIYKTEIPGVSNIQTSDRFISPYESTYLFIVRYKLTHFSENNKFIAQSITFTKGGTKYCRLMITELNQSNKIISLSDFQFPLDELQKLATENSFGQLNTNNPNEILHLITYFQKPVKESNWSSQFNKIRLSLSGPGINYPLAAKLKEN